MDTLTIIASVSKNGVIGNSGGLPWHYRKDMLLFREHTDGCPVIMGRKTWDSIPDKYKPLYNRFNIVISKQDLDITGVKVVKDFDLAVIETEEGYYGEYRSWVIGGASIYKQAMPYCDSMLITKIDKVYKGDTKFPDIPSDEWSSECIRKFKDGGTNLSLIRYKRISKWIK